MAETYLLNGDYIGDLNEDNPFQSHEHYTTLMVQCKAETAPLVELKFEEQALSVSSFEKEKGAHWQVEILLAGKHESVDLSDLSGVIDYTLTPLEMRDWVSENQKDFPPLEIGSFYIHGSHLPPKEGVFSLEIDAGRAFGTGEHATTAGCLLAMERLAYHPTGSKEKEASQKASTAMSLRSGSPSRSQKTERGQFDTIADIGCGTGILTLAARYLWPDASIIGGDMDAPSVTTAIENAEKNGMTDLTFVTAAGTQHPKIQERTPYDLIVANILAGPLVDLAPEMRKALAEDGVMILSGLLVRQQEEVVAAYVAQGLELVDEIHRDEWSAITLKLSS